MKYFEELKRSMEFIASKKESIFLGQAVSVPGTAMRNTLININKNKLLELPVAEEMQMGMAIGLSMEKYIPICIYPRWNFLLLAMNQLINHLNNLNELTENKLKSKIIIRTAVGSVRPLHPQSQHVGDFTNEIKKICTNINVIKITDPKKIFEVYKHAYERKDNISSLIVEVADYYNEK